MSASSPDPWRALRVWWALIFVLGLCLTFAVAARVIYEVEGYNAGGDCDDCGVTLLLDNLGWLALTAGAYLGLFYLAARRFGARN